MKWIISLMVLVACGDGHGNPGPSSTALSQTANCKQEDLCTNANVLGYDCAAVTIQTSDGCIVAKQDYELDPNCNPQNPDNVCKDWNGGTYPCCQTIQGPGPSVQN
jgi:hypothetical protein